jgi:hypothetical protein
MQPTAPMGFYGVVSNVAGGHVVTTILIAGVAMLFTALSYGRMTRVYPSAGSAYTYVGKELNPVLGFIVGWSLLMDYVLNPIICAIWFGAAAQNVLPSIPFAAWAISFVILLIYVDTKDATPQDLIEAIERHDMGDHVMFWSEHPDFLMQIHTLRPNWIIMPEAFNPDNVQKIVDRMHPQLLGADERDFNAPTIAAAKAANTGIFVDRQTEQEWQDAVDQGAVGIQTNHPAALIAYLRAHGYHK